MRAYSIVDRSGFRLGRGLVGWGASVADGGSHLGREVVGRADYRRGELRRLREGACDAEVAELDAALGEEQVLGLCDGKQ